MNVHEFIYKWSKVALTERSASQQHFLDLCEVVGHGKPAELDPEGDSFTFEKGAAKYGGGRGWADVWKRGFFAWEYKGRDKDLSAAYDQLLRYREALENPPLLVVCDMDRLVVHTNFTGRPTVVHEIPLQELARPEQLEIVQAIFHDPERLQPGTTREAITLEAASRFAEIAQTMRARGLDPQAVARFLDRIVFLFFAQSIRILLPEGVVPRILNNSRDSPELFTRLLSGLFREMAQGGFYGADKIRHFNGNLFADDFVLTPTREELEKIYRAGRLDWSAIDPSVLGTLFERGLDPDKRSQLGAHYTSREDIETLVEPVVMQPLRREWTEIRRVVENVLATGKKEPNEKDREKIVEAGLQGPALRKARYEADLLLRRFWERLGHVKVLDPACGSGNFLYVTLQKLKDLEKETILYAMSKGFSGLLPLVGPWQLYGIEINPYAFELAQMSIWIGHLQWIRDNGFGEPDSPVLRPMESFKCMDAILDLSDPENPKEPDWPAVDFIVGNPPFLGDKRMRAQLGDTYAILLRNVYAGRLPAQSDLCCYWFEKAREMVQQSQAWRVGLLATQAIRGGLNRTALLRIKETGDIFYAESDRPWILEGAQVHVSMVAFDDGSENLKVLDGQPVVSINANLTHNADLTRAKRLSSMSGSSFIGISMHGSFDFDDVVAEKILLSYGNPNGRPNSDVVRPILNYAQLVSRVASRWVVFFPPDLHEEAASLYERPFEFVRSTVKPSRDNNPRKTYREKWWLHGEARPAMLLALSGRGRFLGTNRTGKHRVFFWVEEVVLPSDQIVAFPEASDERFGILHSRCHELWARAQGTQLRERQSGFRYTPTTTFETFPLPEATPDQQAAIGASAKELDNLRTRWFSPPEWTHEEILEFPGSADGPWAGYLQNPDSNGIGTVRYPRLVPNDKESTERLQERNLTDLYNQRPAWLDLAHRKLDEAVFAAYGWDPGMSDEEVLAKLLALNLERAGEESELPVEDLEEDA